ncbi:hypothetical protein D1159_16660 [Pseudoflavonifractor sp. 524-17]|uniref:hypothetical protein n=1 Tax=Pseudoflavonifractor sp. 524-17 TaxID=2304577 RepID=UPI00137B6D1E|nr:hypothetical protein [Pseudoflavonifractor sp. 524-17]NCE66160.1 hypothetical protein [Pseudoflavonifractor sp. 524-17]
MSEVNADGVLLNPAEALLQEVQHLSNALMAERPRHLEDYQSRTEMTTAANGEIAGLVGGRHMPADVRARRSGPPQEKLR